MKAKQKFDQFPVEIYIVRRDDGLFNAYTRLDDIYFNTPEPQTVYIYRRSTKCVAQKTIILEELR